MNIIEVSYYSDSQNFRQDPTEKLIGVDIYFKFEWFQMISNDLQSAVEWNRECCFHLYRRGSYNNGISMSSSSGRVCFCAIDAIDRYWVQHRQARDLLTQTWFWTMLPVLDSFYNFRRFVHDQCPKSQLVRIAGNDQVNGPYDYIELNSTCCTYWATVLQFLRNCRTDQSFLLVRWMFFT